MKRTLSWILLCACSVLGSCISRGYPTHGGGKRFFREQEILTRATDAAVGSLDFEKVFEVARKAKPPGSLPQSGGGGDERTLKGVTLIVSSVAHSGGGVQTGSNIGIGGLVSGLFTGGAMMATGQAPAPGQGPIVGPGAYASYVFESADDIRYLAAVVERCLASRGVACFGLKDGAVEAGLPVVRVVVKEFGIDQSDLNLIVYGEKRLKARVVVDAYASMPEGGHFESLGVGQASYTFAEDFFLGFGPLSNQNVEGGVTNER